MIFLNSGVNSQIMVLPEFESIYLFGPQNIESPNVLYAMKSISLFDELIAEIDTSINNNLNQIEMIPAEKKNKRINKRKIKRLLKEIKENKELKGYILDFRKMWVDFIEQENLKNEFIEDCLEGGCFDLTTSTGIIKFGEYDFRVDTFYEGNIVFNEFIDIANNKSKFVWVKKKSDNCVSADPDDCIIYCRIYQEEDCIHDYRDKKLKYCKCPEGFEYDDIKRICYKKISLYNNKNFIHVEIINKNKQYNKFEILDWKKVDCY